MNLSKAVVAIVSAVGLCASSYAQGLIGTIVKDTVSELRVVWVWDQETEMDLSLNSGLTFWDASLSAFPAVVPLAPRVQVTARHLGKPHDHDGTASSFSHLARVGDPLHMGGADHPVVGSSQSHGDTYILTIGPATTGPVTITLSGGHVEAIPEPETYALLLVGLGLLVVQLRRTRSMTSSRTGVRAA
ncbi:PEP-CTERM sorting domain-containing protein [Schlegelella sp. S2-27]|uniref:PEP-CTERM sorting domain-containing protein n=1 Tax=Caldimonas mangrovi TaxID=2944811 RepID=A0ABT0YLF6_9BURK|nr:PEP-CTERM sorting domain-containing protein [Caldimonas mangrovi]MCM5679568.1 PEP-CTERM sorting domain-containing protein [Caldimonas mangrovi]